jgi:catechol 2,3-dioxygenase-like lactoylglutathione lyase family enzyme
LTKEADTKRSFFQVHELTHVHIPVSSLDRSLDWYTENLGLEPTFREGDRLVFLSLPGSGSLLALNSTKGKPVVQPIHFGFKISGGTVAIEAWRARLKKSGVHFSVRMHGERVRGLYLTDPDGYTIEIYCD